VTCPRCGSEEPEGSRFCGSCGATFAPAEEPVTELQPPAPPPPRRRPHVPRGALIAMLVLLVAALVGAVLLGTGVIGGDSSNASESTFAHEANERVLLPLAHADGIAAEHARSGAGASTSGADGSRIMQAADDATTYLRSLNDLSEEDRRAAAMLLGVVAVNRRFGEALAGFDSTDESEVALQSAAVESRTALAAVRSRLPQELRLPSDATFIALRAAPSVTTTETTETTATTETMTAPQPNVAVVYVQQVDGLLRESHTVVLGLRSFIPRAASGAMARDAAVATAQSYLTQRRRELAQAQSLAPPPAFARAHALLVQSLQSSVADDEALVDWTVARRDGSGNAQAALDEVNRIGAEATALKRQFLRTYGAARQAATGRSPAGLPDAF